MPSYTQEGLPMRVDSDLGADTLLLRGFSGEEGMSMPFSYTLDLESEDASVDGVGLLQTAALVTLKLPGGEDRFFHGLIRRFVQMGQATELTSYRAEVAPWFWFLSLSSDCRVFQNLSVPDIVEQVFRNQGYGDFEFRCSRQYPAREYCVQYRETHLNFVTRLLEEEGIFYFFEHSRDKHVLVLADSTSAVRPCPGQGAARVVAAPRSWEGEDVVTSVQREHAVHTGKITLRDYDYLQPTLQLENTMGQGTELYEYPGNYSQPSEGDRYARLLLETQESMHQVIRGDGRCRSFQSGHKFDLRSHYRADVNQSYQLLRVQHTARLGDFASGDGGSFDYQNSFEAIPHNIAFRPPRTAIKSVAPGSQTAVVVGKSGEEIWVDRHGRVKVQFPWDRIGTSNENSSCWVRVASTWAGKSWGSIQIPRIGQEVIVEFVEGDLDRPIITGRVYNADQTVPYGLPANQTQSGIKSRSSKNGGADNFNEIRFEDKKGSEEIFIHAEKDLKTEAENDETRTIGHDRITTIENDDTETVKQGNQTVTIEMGNQEVTLKQGNQTIVLSMGNQETKLDQGNVTTKAALGTIAFEAMQAIELKVGQNSIKIEQAGVTIKGLNVKVEGQVQAEIKSVMTTVKGDGMLTVKGGITMIN